MLLPDDLISETLTDHDMLLNTIVQWKLFCAYGKFRWFRHSGEEKRFSEHLSR